MSKARPPLYFEAKTNRIVYRELNPVHEGTHTLGHAGFSIYPPLEYNKKVPFL